MMTDGFFDKPRLHHIGIVAPTEKQAEAQMKKLGLKEAFRGYVEKWDVLCIFAQSNGGSPLEFVVAFSGPLKNFNRGLGGLHHIALAVPDIRASMKYLAENGVTMLEDEPVRGAGPFLCNFLHPIFTGGFTVELVEELDQSGSEPVK
jgi:catechol 2,3-dioxygenase-like lactoylglutathione lyase family enzyme